MVDTSTNIDAKLGVSNLVKTNQNQSGEPHDSSLIAAPTKSRQNLDHWSTNNGSIIYSQSELVKNHFMAHNSKPKSLAFSESQQVSSGANCDLTSAQPSQHYNLSKYTKRGCLQAATDEKVVANNCNYRTLRPAKVNSTNKNQLIPDQNNSTGDDHNPDSSNESQKNWSNESGTASDLLF